MKGTVKYLMKEELYCSNCGAKMYVHADRCPYCGFINISGAEKKYMDSLEGIREKLDNVDEEAANEYNRGLNKSIKQVLVVIGILLIITVTIFVVRGIYKYETERKATVGAMEQMDELLWQKEKFAEFDALYEAKDYEAMVDAVCNQYYGNHELYNWKHWDFAVVLYDYYNLTKNELADLDAGKTDNYLYTNMIYESFKFYYELYGYRTFTPEETIVINDARSEVIDVLHNRLNFTDAQMEELDAKYKFTNNGYIRYDDCKKIAKKYGKQFK